MTKEIRGFSPEWDFMEPEDIRELQLLIDNIKNPDHLDSRERFLQRLEKDWARVYEDRKRDPQELLLFLKFVRTNVILMDSGGMNMGRSRIGHFLEVKNRELWGSHPEEMQQVAEAMDRSLGH